MNTRPDAKNMNWRQVYERNIHDTMKSLPQQRDRRKKDYERVLTLFDTGEHARDRRNKVCEITPGNMTISRVSEVPRRRATLRPKPKSGLPYFVPEANRYTLFIPPIPPLCLHSHQLSSRSWIYSPTLYPLPARAYFALFIASWFEIPCDFQAPRRVVSVLR